MSLRLSLACLTLASCLLGQGSERLSLESIAHPTLKKTYAGMPGTKLEWLPDGALLQTKREGEKLSLLRVDPKTWEAKPLLDSERLLAALVAASAPADAAKAALGRGSFAWDSRRSSFLLDVAGDLFHVDVLTASAKKVAGGKPDEPSLSPDGAQVAFLRGNDLYRVELANGQETRLTTGGSETVFNGRLDWVYQEEVYGRGSFKAFWWSPDSKRLAYLSLDETKVPVFTLMDDRIQPQQPRRARYPQAGEPNPIARLGVVDLQGHSTWMVDPHAGQETLITRVTWDPKGYLTAVMTDRIQTWMEYHRYEGTNSKVLVKELGQPWVDAEHHGAPIFFKDGGFLWESEQSGHRHIERHAADGKLVNTVTTGTWEVRKLQGLDEARGLVFFDASLRSPIGQDTFSIHLDGSGLTRLTERPGTHTVRFNATYSAFLDTWSDIQTPPQQSLCNGSGQLLRLIDANPSEALQQVKLGKVSFQQVKTRDGFLMESMLILPVDFNPSRKYPVFQEIYGGPGTPEVHNAWSRSMMWFQFLAQQGYIVWVCDNRSASAKGQVSAAGIYQNLGAQELQDLLDSHAWLKAQGWADMERLCLDGWSYGGFMTTYALTHCKAWKLGIAGAPVVDWSLYDSIYTERYMGLPSVNKAGYASSSVLNAAKDFSGKLLLLHGTLDDNVHPQNSIMLINAAEGGPLTADRAAARLRSQPPRSPAQLGPLPGHVGVHLEEPLRIESTQADQAGITCSGFAGSIRS